MMDFAAMYWAAHAAGCAAAEAAKPVAMVVSEADVLTGAALPEGKSWYVSEGACGFAWIKVRPGNCAFAKWLVKHGKARGSYTGGVDIWVSEYGQSVARKEAFASAFAEALVANGVKAFADSRLD